MRSLVLFELYATHDKRPGGFGVVIAHTLVDIVIERAVAVLVAAQSAHGATTGKRPRLVGIFLEQLLAQPVISLLRNLDIGRVDVTFVYRLGIGIHKLRRNRSLGKVAFAIDLVEHLIPKTVLILILGQRNGHALDYRDEIGTTGVILGHIIEHIDQRHEPPAHAASPEIGRMPRSGIGPTLIAALVVGVEIESRAVVESAAGTDKELLHGIIDQLGFIKSSSVTGEKRRCHIEAVEPYLVRINEFMPKCPLMGTGLACQLTDKNVHRLFVLGIA